MSLCERKREHCETELCPVCLYQGPRLTDEELEQLEPLPPGTFDDIEYEPLPAPRRRREQEAA